MRALPGQLAQLVEQRIENPRVRGSIPRLATRIQSRFTHVCVKRLFYILGRLSRKYPAQTVWDLLVEG